jgi:endogenous inhibitor of DNA gyrase (YacG/DUF329 family)
MQTDGLECYHCGKPYNWEWIVIILPSARTHGVSEKYARCPTCGTIHAEEDLITVTE